MAPTSDENHATTWADFLSRIREARKELGNPPIVWFRGQAKTSYELVPSLSRHSRWEDKERAVFDEYERSAAHLFRERRHDWELLNDMQHYGIPTRLLDWTDALGVAIAFALDHANDDLDSGIFLLDPIALNLLSMLKGVKRALNDPDFDYKTIYWEGRPFAPQLPIAIDGMLHNERLRAQSGSFTIHGFDSRPLEIQAPAVVRKVVLTAAVKPEAREFLEHANLNVFRLYPDIVGMARHIVRKHFGS